MAVLGIGTDIVECLRIAQMIERHGELFLNRVFTPREIEYCSARKAATQHYAGRWAAKEAILKAPERAGPAEFNGGTSRSATIPPENPRSRSAAVRGKRANGWESLTC